MGRIRRARRGIGKFIASDNGQRFFNFAYSIGAAIVIWGALFKILHLPGGNTLLSIGMGTEVLMFVLTAFDRPPREYQWEQVFPALDHDPEHDGEQPEGTTGTGGVTIVQGGAVAVGGGSFSGGSQGATGAVAQVHTPAPVPAENISEATTQYLDQINAMTEQMHQLHDSTAALNAVSDTLLHSYEAITQNSAQINGSSTGYVEQMAALNRNIQGLNTIYEIQLKSISSQLDSIERVNHGIKDIRDMYEKSAEQSARYCAETEKMARYMQQLNTVYEKMLQAMTVNMMAVGGAAQRTPNQQ